MAKFNKGDKVSWNGVFPVEDDFDYVEPEGISIVKKLLVEKDGVLYYRLNNGFHVLENSLTFIEE